MQIVDSSISGKQTIKGKKYFGDRFWSRIELGSGMPYISKNFSFNLIEGEY